MSIPHIIERLTTEHLRKLRYALGLNKRKKPWRNYYGSIGANADWEHLCDLGIARRSPSATKEVTYTVTFEAAKALYGKPMSRNYFDNCLDEQGTTGKEHIRRSGRKRRRRHPLG